MMDYDLRHGRTYMYATAEPQYAFGHGLSYATFAYANAKTAPRVKADGTIAVTLDVTNTGTRAGEDVVQLYARFPRSAVDRPRKQLRAFQRVAIPPGETRTVRLDVPVRDLAYWDVKRKGWTVEPGPVELLVGRSSRDADLTLRATVEVLADAVSFRASQRTLSGQSSPSPTVEGAAVVDAARAHSIACEPTSSLSILQNNSPCSIASSRATCA